MNNLMGKLQILKEDQVEVTIYILNGYQCKGTIIGYDQEFISIVNSLTGKENVILMNAISTIEC